ncbi:MAG: hypothetical protein ABIQ99_05910 [Thermoflexales bacterium]
MAQVNTAAPGPSARPILVGIARALDAAAGALHMIAGSRAATLVSIALMIGGIFALGLQETGRGDLRIYDTEVTRISASMGGRYIRITGHLDTTKPYQTRLNLGPIELRGGEWVSLVGLDTSDRIWVTRSTLPAGASGTQTLVGRLTLGDGQEPPIYLDVAAPPDVETRDRLAAIGGIAAMAVIAGYIVTVFARRADFAPRLPAFATSASPNTPAHVWFGAVIPGAAESTARNTPIRIALSRTEARVFGPGWETAIRHAISVSAVSVATRFGALPGMRIVFEDERGLIRRAVLASGTVAMRDQLITALNYIGR